jgi:hypothetical protein
MSGAPQVAMRIASQIWQIIFASQTLQVFCFSFASPSDFLFGPLQKGTICSSDQAKLQQQERQHQSPHPAFIHPITLPCPRFHRAIL